MLQRKTGRVRVMFVVIVASTELLVGVASL